jgi:CNT family concentrative nucleoside transporter
MKPETGTPELVLDNVTYGESGEPANVIDAAAAGAISGMKLAVNIGAMLIAFIALIALLNDSVAGIFGWFNIEGMTIEKILGYVFFPITYLIGVPMEDAVTAGGLIGQKLVLNEFVAYANMVQIQDTLNPHTQIVITFALCGFANFSSIAIMLGGLGSIAPKRNNEIAKLGLKAVLAASLANLMSAALAGFFITL